MESQQEFPLCCTISENNNTAIIISITTDIMDMFTHFVLSYLSSFLFSISYILYLYYYDFLYQIYTAGGAGSIADAMEEESSPMFDSPDVAIAPRITNAIKTIRNMTKPLPILRYLINYLNRYIKTNDKIFIRDLKLVMYLVFSILR